MKTTLTNKYYKTALSLSSIAVTSFAISQFALLLKGIIHIQYDWRFELSMVIGQLFFQFPFISKKPWSIITDYYYNMLMVSFIGSVLLLPLVAYNKTIRLGTSINLCYFFSVVLYMFFEHKKRVAKLTLPFYISYTWVLYRFFILIYLLW